MHKKYYIGANFHSKLSTPFVLLWKPNISAQIPFFQQRSSFWRAGERGDTAAVRAGVRASSSVLGSLTGVTFCCRADQPDRPAGPQWEHSARDSRVSPCPAQLPQCPALPVHQLAADQCKATRYVGCWAAPSQPGLAAMQVLLHMCRFSLVHGDFVYFFPCVYFLIKTTFILRFLPLLLREKGDSVWDKGQQLNMSPWALFPCFWPSAHLCSLL